MAMMAKSFGIVACIGLLTSDVSFSADAEIPLPLSSAPSFAGFYAAGGAGYGVSTWRNYFMRESLATASLCCFVDTGEASGQVTPQGWLGTAVTGYNIQYGTFLGGIELSGRWGKEGADSLTSRTVFPTTGGFVANIDHQYQFRSDSGVSLAARAGVVFNRTLVFGKLGVGVAHAEDRFSFQGSGTVCINRGFNPIGPNPCIATAPIGSALLTIARWSPSVVAGVGIEHNIGRFFVRVGAELEGIYGLNGTSNTVPATIDPHGTLTSNVSGSATSEAFWITRGTALVGFRF
jgi:opacity protein-like surface antigen